MITKERIKNKLEIKGDLKEISLEHLNTEEDVENLIDLYEEIILYNEEKDNSYFLQNTAYETEDKVLILVFEKEAPNEDSRVL